MEEKEFRDLIDEILEYGSENEWIEFKVNNDNPQMLGEYLSALSNSACLHKTKHGYLVYGIDDNLKIVGTKLNPKKEKGKGNEDLEPWLLRLLNPRINFEILQGNYDENNLVVFKIDSAKKNPVEFGGVPYVRISSHKKKLKSHPEKERELWRILNEITFEEGIALEKVEEKDILDLIDYTKYFSLMKLGLPENAEAILSKLEEEKLISKQGKKYSITNLGAILFAKDLNKFKKLSRKKVRVIFYEGASRTGRTREREHKEGYAILFENLMQYILDQLPANEVIKTALREDFLVYPPIAIRELLGNILVHQDFFVEGSGPMIEFFSNRVEFTNPGEPLINTNRFIDHAPISRNGKLAGFMRRIKICEERGSGIDKVIESIEKYKLPAPEFIADKNFMKVILYSYREFESMDKSDRMRACYHHCSLKYVSREYMTNTTLRERFNLKKEEYVKASIIIRGCIKIGVIKRDESGRYLPYWA